MNSLRKLSKLIGLEVKTMKCKLALDTTKKLLLSNGLLFLATLAVQTVTNFAGNEYITLPVYVEAALQLISIVLYVL